MTDKDLSDKIRKLATRFRQQMEPHTPFAEGMVWQRAAEAVEALLPPPPRPTLADMNEEERRASRWDQADVANVEARPVIVNPHWQDGIARVMWPGGIIERAGWEKVTPRPDLPRMEWPGDTPAPAAPALPDGWRLADHKEHGRVIVTNPTPDCYGHAYFAFSRADCLSGLDWKVCDPDDLTYLDQGDDTDDTERNRND